MAITESSIESALERGKALDRIQPRALATSMDQTHHRLVLDLDNGAQIAVPFSLLPERVAGATEMEKANVCIEGAGHDLYWPDLDEGLYIPDLCAKATFGELAIAA
ncbi:MAG: DUF2442 domain-containing protein [Thiomonas sp.]|uniref:DUF2442 domain-containing protein n=1 Tax=Thiomonas sp. TaxID=2047785 RepID=UPI002A370038|nr:DUF2442 domain-containing protein [Thiomonas sp.]MDY0330837.1 DUF2442 domain-containing protein [Thiomonas sp.]